MTAFKPGDPLTLNRLYGRSSGHKLRKSQQELVEKLLPEIEVPEGEINSRQMQVITRLLGDLEARRRAPDWDSEIQEVYAAASGPTTLNALPLPPSAIATKTPWRLLAACDSRR